MAEVMRPIRSEFNLREKCLILNSGFTCYLALGWTIKEKESIFRNVSECQIEPFIPFLLRLNRNGISPEKDFPTCVRELGLYFFRCRVYNFISHAVTELRRSQFCSSPFPGRKGNLLMICRIFPVRCQKI